MKSTCLAALILSAASMGVAAADCCSVFRLSCESYGHRAYLNYPYSYSYGVRYDPYWSYKSSYFPETYHGDGSYYGLGYSGTGGRGWYGSYWYW
jgi:hypothetical protein